MATVKTIRLQLKSNSGGKDFGDRSKMRCSSEFSTEAHKVVSEYNIKLAQCISI